MYESFDKFDAWCGNYIGFSSRSNSRLDSPSLELSRSLAIGRYKRGDSELVD